MKKLYHWPLDPVARTVRVTLGEKRLPFESAETRPWSVHPEVERLAPGAAPPALIDQTVEGRIVVLGSHAMVEFLETAYPTSRLIPTGQQDAAEARRLWRWCEDAFQVVNENLLAERITQWVRRDRQPDSGALRKGSHALRGRLTFLNALAEQRSYIAGRHMSVADVSVAAHLSSLDYFGDVDWDTVPDLRAWYARMKSRPSFRPLLEDHIDGTRPAKHYGDLDF
ncbi:MAG: glutathione S-transferase family protein [Pseudomonadota bacterium]